MSSDQTIARRTEPCINKDRKKYVRYMAQSIQKYAISNPIAITFIIVAVLVRLVFWIYTGRVWEDALITLAPARNVWLGNGLTHHVSEARVHSFTSPVSVLVPLIADGFHEGLFFLRAVSLVAAAAAIYFANQIGKFIRLHWVAQVVMLGYLATDQIQIYFGMVGMETQIATAVFLASAYFYFKQQWRLFGFVSGIAMLTRPEFVFFVGVFGVLMLIQHPKAILRTLLCFLGVVAPWYIFAQLYYGSIIPNTIVAKSVHGAANPFASSFADTISRFQSGWAGITPFKEWFFTTSIPIPDIFTTVAVNVVLGLFLIGMILAIAKKEWRIVCLGIVALIFFVYRASSGLSKYYMWYIPPFSAMIFLIAAFGLSGIAKQRTLVPVAVGFFVFGMYALHIPFSFPIERRVQEKIECGVRFKTGVILDSMMGANDTVTLEPLGYIGYAAFNKTTYDWPGLSSRTVVNRTARRDISDVAELTGRLRPSFAVLRQKEVEEFRQKFPDVAKDYVDVANINLDPDTDLSLWGYTSNNYGDGHFSIYRRTAPTTELAAPMPLSDTKSIDVYGVCSK